MSYTTTTATALMSEYIEPTLRDSFPEDDDTFTAFLEGPKVRTNALGRRISFNVAPNPSYGSTAEGAQLPVAGSGVEIQGRVFYFNQFLVGEINREVLDQDNDKAIVGLLKNRQQRDTKTFRQRQNLWMFGRGDGALGVLSDASGATTLVFGGDYGSENIIVGSRLRFFTAGGVQRVGGGVVTSTVLTNDGLTTITVDQVPNDLAATDTAHYELSYGLAPHGLAKHVSDVSDDWFGINTATYSTIKATVHDAQNNPLLPGMIDLTQAKARRRTGFGAPVNDRVLISHTTQQFNYQQLGYDLFRTVPTLGSAKLDLGFPRVGHNGMRWKVDQNCQRSIIYGLKLSDFAIVYIKLPGFYSTPGGDKLWAKPTEGGLYDRVQYAICARYDLICYERRNQWKIENLPYMAGM